MAFEQITPDFGNWIAGASALLILRICFVAVGLVTLGFAVSSARRGPAEGFYGVARIAANGVRDFSNWSFGRTIAMAMLAMQEAIRRRVLIVFVVFIALILLGGWFLDVKSDHPARLYLSFVLTASNYLVVLLALFLSAFSLPADIKNRTIYTVVTKPVRPQEIIVGRILGFVAIGTLLLIPMGLISYFFVTRGLSHDHAVEVENVVAVSGEGDIVARGETTYDAHHRHTFELFEDGTGQTDLEMSHWHNMTQADDGSYQVGPAVGLLQARNPHFGALRFKDRNGQDTDKGINVGHEWSYRSYIEGGTLAAGIWTFDNITPGRYPDGLDLELNLRVFRTHKGNIEEGIIGAIEFRNPNTNAEVKRSEPITFTAVEFRSDKRLIPRKIRVLDPKDGGVRDGDLFDLVDNGKIEMRITCGDRGQYYGMAERDVYILGKDGVFALNLAKGYVGIWLQMVIATAIGVMFSTIVSGAVAMMATLSSIVIGFFTTFVIEVATGTQMGGGPVESFIRIFSQANLQVDLEIGQASATAVQGIDRVMMTIMTTLAGMLPDYRALSTSQYVAYGYNIDASLVSIQLLTTFAYVAVFSLIAYFLLKTREVAA
jgi:ABC-type transport system involved in multi-copper enzyme maturation permease subunit